MFNTSQINTKYVFFFIFILYRCHNIIYFSFSPLSDIFSLHVIIVEAKAVTYFTRKWWLIDIFDILFFVFPAIAQPAENKAVDGLLHEDMVVAVWVWNELTHESELCAQGNHVTKHEKKKEEKDAGL